MSIARTSRFCFGVALLGSSAILAPVGALAGCMDSDNAFWLTDVTRPTYEKLMSMMSCPADSDTQTAAQVDAVVCNYFVAKALSVLYTVPDFLPDQNAGQWPTADQIAAFVRTHGDLWIKLGQADTPSVLADAAQGADQGQPTIAVQSGDPHGHVALILGGSLQHSTNWNMDVPNSAAFSLDHVGKAYVFCGLSWAFSKPDAVEIYSRVKVK